MTDPEDSDRRTAASPAEEALRVSEERLRLALAAGRLGIWEWEIPTGRVFWSPETFQLLEVDPREFTGAVDQFNHLVHPDDRERFQKHLERSLRGEGDFEIEFRVIRPRGGLGWMLNRATIVRDAAGAPLRMVGIISDITERKQTELALQRSEERLRRAIMVAPLPIMIHADDGQVVSLNHTWTEITGYTLEQIPTIEAWTSRAYGSGEIRRQAREVIDQLYELDGISHDGEFTVTDARGGKHVWDFRSAPLGMDADGRRLSISVALDVTGWKNAEDALREADQRKNNFLAMLSHELRNPLGPIRNAVHFLRLSGPPEPALARAFDMIDRQVVHMSRLVDELLDVSRIARGRIHLRKDRCDLCRIVRETAEDYQNTLEAGGLAFELRMPPAPLWTCGDETRLAQVVSNILHNAGKFTGSGGRVTVSLVDSGDGAAVLRVRDTGIGVAPAMLPRLFEPFSHDDRRQDRSRGGLGLGLALVKGLVELHGGAVSAASEGLGRGTEVTVRLPLDPSACEDQEESA